MVDWQLVMSFELILHYIFLYFYYDTKKEKEIKKKGKINYLKIDAKRKSRELLIFKKSRNRNNDEKFLFQTMHVFHYLDTLFNIFKKRENKKSERN